MMAWGISACATGLALVALWLYGDGNKRAPIIWLAVCLCWVVYDILFEQWALLLPTALNIIVQIRNLRRMNLVDKEAK